MLFFALLLAAFGSGPAPKDGVLRVTPHDSLALVSQRLAKDASIREVVLASGTYPGGWSIPPLEGADAASHPLSIGPAEGARVLFDGARPLSHVKPAQGRPGVFTATFEPMQSRETPKIWEPAKRVRYLLAADLDAVARFPASALVVDGVLYLHTTDGSRPGKDSILSSVQDFGIEVRRPGVTVRGLSFRNFTARGKLSAAVQARAGHVTIERCEAENASFGFTLLGDDGLLVESGARDVGGGVYIAGKRDRVERNRFLKERDRFVVPTYEQDDTAIQAYDPAEAGAIRGNLAVGFGMGILIKAPLSPWVVEANTLVSPDERLYGFLATRWHPDSVFRRNVVAGYTAPETMGNSRTAPGVDHNCDSPAPVADPKFADAPAGDFRLAPGSPCLAGPEGESIGADLKLATKPRPPVPDEPAAADAASRRRSQSEAARREGGPADEPRTWHVAPGGSDDAAGSASAPLRTIQSAIDRSRPGDTVLLHPGIYSEPVRIDHGGTGDRPITLRATDRWKAILDGARRYDAMVRIVESPFVVIQDLEIRWYRQSGIDVSRSPGVRVEGCRIWNDHWGGNWPEGNGVRVMESPRFTGTRNVLFNQEIGFYLVSSPQAAITSNTAVANLYAGVRFARSLEGSTCTDNSFAYQGNDAISFEEREGGLDRLKQFHCDYNNYGVTLQPGEPGDPPLVPRPQDRQLFTQSKAIVLWQEAGGLRRFRTMAGWREFSGVDAHSIIADPLFVDSKSFDFRLEAQSPNRGAGTDGATIGALEN